MKLHFKIVALLFLAFCISIFNYQLRKAVYSLDIHSHKEWLIGDIVKESHTNIHKRSRKKILMYTTLFGSMPWWQAPYDYNFTDFDGRPCPVSDCDITYNKSQISSSDLVVFYGRDLPSIQHMKTIAQNKRRPYQKWIFFMHESPVYSYFNETSLNGIFNLTASYRSDSDILVNYCFYDPLEDKDPRPKAKQNFAEGKTKVVSWINSHCDKDRVSFIENLRKFIKVDVYGGCSKHFKPQTPNCPRNSKECKDTLGQYKFSLAIENSFCIDYITEKYWLNGLDAGLVPVVLGYGDYKNSKLAIPGSYIDARDFRSMEELANYLLFLDKNDDAYNGYHQWRYHYKLAEHNFMCFFCEAIQSYNIPSKTVDMVKFWGKETCDLSKQPLRHLIASAQKST